MVGYEVSGIGLILLCACGWLSGEGARIDSLSMSVSQQLEYCRRFSEEDKARQEGRGRYSAGRPQEQLGMLAAS